MANTKTATVIYPNHDLSFFEIDGGVQFHPEEEYADENGLEPEDMEDLQDDPKFVSFVKESLKLAGVTHVVDTETQDEPMTLQEYFDCLFG